MNWFTLKVSLVSLFFCICFSACNSSKTGDQINHLENHISLIQDSLRIMRNEYRPGLEELMSDIQLHHAKLWFAGTNSNWPLAYFELGEIRETMRTAASLETNRPEIRQLPMIYPSLDSVANAINLREPDQFKRGYTLMTNACNSCHQSVNFSFNVITIPTAPPVTDQDFKPHMQ